MRRRSACWLAMDRRTGGRGKSVCGGGMRWSGIEELSCFIAHRCLDSESYRIVERASMFKTCAFSWRPGRRTREHISACMPSGHQDAARARRHSDNGTFFSGHRPHLNNRSWPRPRCSECRVFFFVTGLSISGYAHHSRFMLVGRMLWSR
jgi:hypothetical protein